MRRSPSKRLSQCGSLQRVAKQAAGLRHHKTLGKRRFQRWPAGNSGGSFLRHRFALVLRPARCGSGDATTGLSPEPARAGIGEPAGAVSSVASVAVSVDVSHCRSALVGSGVSAGDATETLSSVRAGAEAVVTSAKVDGTRIWGNPPKTWILPTGLTASGSSDMAADATTGGVSSSIDRNTVGSAQIDAFLAEVGFRRRLTSTTNGRSGGFTETIHFLMKAGT